MLEIREEEKGRIQLSGRFDSPDWKIVYQRKMATYGISAEALVARKSGD